MFLGGLAVVSTDDDTGRNAEFVRCETESFLSRGLRDTGYFEKHGARADHSDPCLNSTFTFTHPSFWWATGNGFVRKHTDPNFPLTFKLTVDGNTAGFNLTVGHPSATETLKSEVTEAYGVSALGVSTTVSALSLAELHSFGH